MITRGTVATPFDFSAVVPHLVSVSYIADPERWQAASTLAAADARVRFSLDEVVAPYEAFYERALDSVPEPC